MKKLVPLLAVLAALSPLRADLANVALDGVAAANGPIYANWPTWRLINGARDDVVHGDASLPTGFAYTIDLGKDYSIRELKLYPRQDNCCSERFSNVRVSLHLDDGTGGVGAEVWGVELFTDGSNPGSKPGTEVPIALTDAQTARWLQIMSLADPVPSYALQLSEVEVYAEVPPGDINRAAGTIATSNRPLYGALTAPNLVDGNRATLAHGAQSVDSGFAYEINLGAKVALTRIAIVARQDGASPERLSNYRVSLHNDNAGQIGTAVWTADLHTDYSNPGADPGSKDILTASLDPAGEFIGQWIRILSLDDPVPEYALQISEVEAYGIPEAGVKLLISRQPSDTSAGPGQPASFSTAATVINGDPAQITYQWQADGENIPDATQAIYTIPAVQMNAGGKAYRCVIGYPGIASATTESATLRINYAYGARAFSNQGLYGGWSIATLVDGNRGNVIHGAATIEPGFAYTIDLGTAIKFDRIELYPRQDGCCPERLSNFSVSLHAADAQGQIGDQVWTVDLFTDGSNPGSVGGTVVTLTAAQDPGGKFEGQWVKIMSLDNPIPSYALQLSELEAFGNPASGIPTIVVSRQPADIASAPGRSATFSLEVRLLNGDPAKLTYQWQRNGVNLPGATGTNYTTAPLTEADANSQFRCVIGYPGIADVTSTAARLTFDYNYARGAAATVNQPTWEGWLPARLVDGDFTVNGLIHGASSLLPGYAYAINLGMTVTVSNIVVFGRQDDCCPERLSNYRLSIHEDHNGQPGDMVWHADMHTDGSNTGLEEGKRDVLIADLDPTGVFRGQWIRILSLDDPVPDYALQINEVQVFGRIDQLPAPTLSIAKDGASVVISWSGGALQSAPAVTGPWSDAQATTNPLRLQPSTGQEFYRVRQ